MSIVSIIVDQSARYPVGNEFSPSEIYPEYPFKEQLAGHNKIYGLVRQCLRNAGADIRHLDSDLWNPLGAWIKPGQHVFVLPNYVMHRRLGETREQFSAKCTHASFLRAVLDYAIIASGNPNRISFGNAPIQACNYDRVAEETGALELADFYRRNGSLPIGPYDLRQYAAQWTRFGALINKEHRCSESVVKIDLGLDSLLEELFNGANPNLRVGDYPFGETMSYHGHGRHEYIINRRLLEAEVIISAPKLKTHQKVGITCALKGTVGSIARKECLAHYRSCGPEHGGDEYPRGNWARDLSSRLTERAAAGGTDFCSNLLRIQSKVISRVLRMGKGVMGGGWHGNDTAWRMALDIARILRYARVDGTLSPTPQRTHIVLVDGIVAGEGEGPLRPSPRRLGMILFSPDAVAADLACAFIMGYDAYKIPLITNGFAQGSYPLTEARPENVEFVINGKLADMKSLEIDRPLHPPKGWVGKIERHGNFSNQL